jgi:hypothetical protein
MMKAGLINMGIGVLVAVIGAAVSLGSYAAVSHSGGTYFVAWGAVVVGAWRFILGIIQVIRGAAAGPSDASMAGLMPPPTVKDPGMSPPLANPAAAASTAVVVMGVLFIVQAVMRAVFLALQLLQARPEFFNYPQYVIFSVAVPAILFIAGAAAGILALQRAPIARVFCLVFCGLGLLLQLYGVANIIITASRVASLHLSWQTWILIAANLIIYSAGLIVFARASSPPSPAR